MKIRIIDSNIKASMLRPANAGDGGIDLYASIKEPAIIPTCCQEEVPLGIAVAIPDGWVGLLIPRSSCGIRGLRLANTMGVIDSSYRGEIIAVVYANDTIRINPYDRLCQLVVVPHYDYSKVETTSYLSETLRGEGRFGSTGV